MGRIFDVRGKNLKMCTQQGWEMSSFAYGLADGAIWGRARRGLVGDCQNSSGFSEIDYRYVAHQPAGWTQLQRLEAVS